MTHSDPDIERPPVDPAAESQAQRADLSPTAPEERPRRCEALYQVWESYFLSAGAWKRWEWRGNRISALPHPCKNYCLMGRRHWNLEPRPSNHLLGIFRQGNVIANDNMRILLDMGITFRAPERVVEWEELQIRGHIDLEILLPDEEVYVVGEVKGLNSNTFRVIRAARDARAFFRQKWHVFRGYPTQLLLYCFCSKPVQERGLFVLRDKGSADIDWLWLYPEEHLDVIEWSLQKAEATNRAIEDNTPHLERLNDPDICEDCSWLAPCGPAVQFPSPLLLENEPFIDSLRRREEIHDASREYKQVHEGIVSRLKRMEWGDSKEVLAGPFSIKRTETATGPRFKFDRITEDDNGGE